jgi:hypothetical protein
MTHSPVADRLRAFARLYEHMAEQTWSEDRARDLRSAEKECLEAAAEIDATPTQESMFKSG